MYFVNPNTQHIVLNVVNRAPEKREMKKLLVLAVMLAITLAVATPALAKVDIATATAIPGYPDFEITDKGFLVYQGDLIVGKCGVDSTQDFALGSKSLREEAARACERATDSALLAKTGGPPIILVPIALLVAGSLLIRKSKAQ
jgi:hypothetical protein